MGIRERASAIVKRIVTDRDKGGGWDITITDPAGASASLVGFSNDISQLVDPDTGQAVTGRLASIAVHMRSLSDVGLGLPEGIADDTAKPWIVELKDINDTVRVFKVKESNPDFGIGLVLCYLEIYNK